MQCVSALSTAGDPAVARREVIDHVRGELAGATGSLAFLFGSGHHARTLAECSREVREGGISEHVLGCTGESIVGEGREIEGAPALSLWVAVLPHTEVLPLRIESAEDGIDRLKDYLDGRAPSPARSLFVLGDPFSFQADRWLARVNEFIPGLRVHGGMASASHQPGGNVLVLDGLAANDGAVAVCLDGPAPVHSMVSQGCRPIGRTYLVTKADGNLIRELGRRPVLEVVREMFEELDEDDQELVRGGLHLGRVTDEYRDSFGRGDFLIRNVLGSDNSGALAVADTFRVGQTVQFHVRDAMTADEDLRESLVGAADRRARGALLFSCNGRGTRLFPGPDHDVKAVRDRLGPIPVAGFFAMGEFGPIGGRNFVHGFTASIALFAEPAE